MWFDPQFRAGTDDLAAAVKLVADLLIEYELASGIRKRARKLPDKRKFYVAVEALACNLLLLKATEGDAKLAVPRSHDFLSQKGRNANPVYGQHFIQAVDMMAELELIKKDATGFRHSDRHKMPSLISGALRLPDYLPLDPPDWRSVKRIDDPALIIKKEGKDEDGRAPAVDFNETARTKQWTRQIGCINRFLQNAQIEIAGGPDQLALGKDGQIVAPFRRSLRRIFNNGKWGHGGRLAGGFWMSMERGERKRIRIEGEPIAEVDYRQLFPRLAYVRAQAEQPDGDIYDVQGDKTGRDGWKKLMNALLFADGPLKNWPKETLQQFPVGTKLRDAIEMLCQKHRPIAPLFGTGLGFELMRAESDIIIDVTTQLFKQGITALPLHDAVLVAESRAVAAQKVMQDEFERRAGCGCAIVKIKITPE
ncbi:hypothetical protein HZF03_22760 [Rhodopseudomonas palustris]|nr:hypothetical protein HZF03_22760 [Rhodopseudomonas palustris]RIA02937.1 hypothetical protein D1920_05285 [Rhodopseudomonas palustris]